LEIEAIYNREKKKSEKVKCEENERRDALVRKGEALIATKELIFLREKGAYILSSDIQEDIADKFAKIAGKGATDMFIRKEIRDNMLTSGESLFLTCDLMNALAATAEGISAFYFSRSDSEIGSLSSEHERCMEQLSELIVDTAIIFNEITIVKSLSLGKPKTMRFRGFWDNWGIEALFYDKIAEIS
jgi:hypothetical protein